MAKKRLQVFITERQRRYLVAQAKAEGISRSAVVRALILDDIARTGSTEGEEVENDVSE